jgi:hypothetical protein
MKRLTYAKCPYCEEEFPWVSGLTGEYYCGRIRQKCKKCNNESEITVVESIKFIAKKIK